MKNSNRSDFLDALKGIAILGVVIIHVNAQLLNDIQAGIIYGPFDYEVLILLSYITRFCVPIFIMVTGYLYWNPKIKTDFKSTIKRLIPVILLYLLWSMVYTLPINSIQNGQLNFFNLFILGQSAPPMYYIPLIYIPVVIMLSILKRIYHSPITLGVGLIIFSVVQLSDILVNTYLPDIGFVFVYALFGASFSYIEKISERKQLLIKFLLTMLFVYFIVNLIIFCKVNGVVNLTNNYSYFQLMILAYTLSLFGLFYFTKISFKPMNYLGKKSTVIFLEHWLFYVIIYGIWQQFAVDSGILFYIQLVLISLLVTFLPALFHSKIGSKN